MALPKQVEKQNLYCTRDYSMFETIYGNRQINLGGEIRRLQKKSLAENGWFKHEPAKCICHNGKMFIVDGQHRIEMAKALKIPVYYIIIDMTIDEAKKAMIELQASKSWGISDYCNLYSTKNADYNYIKEQSQKRNISISQAMALNCGTLSSGNVSEAFKSGNYKAREKEYALKVLAIRDIFSDFPEVHTKNALLMACAKIAYIKEVSTTTLMSKVEKHPYMVKHVGNSDSYLDMIEKIYNHHNTKKVPIKFLAHEIMKQRCVA